MLTGANPTHQTPLETVLLLLVAALRRLTRTKPGFDEIRKSPVAKGLYTGLLAKAGEVDLVAAPGEGSALTPTVNRLKYGFAMVVLCSTVLYGPSKRNPTHGVGVVDLAPPDAPAPEPHDDAPYVYSKHETVNRASLLPGPATNWIVSQLVSLQQRAATARGAVAVFLAAPSCLGVWTVLQVGRPPSVCRNDAASPVPVCRC